MKKNIVLSSLTAATLAGLSIQAWAQAAPVKSQYQIPSGESSDAGDGPHPYRLTDGVEISPYFKFTYGKDDNLFLTQSSPTSSNTNVTGIGLVFSAKSAIALYKVGYDGVYGRYNSSSADNYDDHSSFGSAEFVLGSSAGLRAGLTYLNGHDPRGSTDRGISGKPDLYKTNGGNVLFAYGANGAAGRIEVEASTAHKVYTTNRASTVSSDRDNDLFGGRFFYKVAPKTSLLFEAKQEKVNYLLSSSVQDSKEMRYLVGVTWEATAATSGTVKIGQIKKDFSVASKKDYSGTGWDVGIQWLPLSYSKFDFFTGKTFSESTGLGDFMLSTKYGSAWNHAWDSRLSTSVSIMRNEDDYQGVSRNDKTDSIGFKVNYKVLRWLTIGGDITHTDRDSSATGFDYKRNQYNLTLGATL